jgi:hypothetical protein
MLKVLDLSGLHDRLREIAGDRTYRAIGELTRQNSETVRRYMQGQAPSVEFLAAICAAMGVSADWMITGRGPMFVGEAKSHALREANAAELLSAVATTLESLGNRLDRLEVFVQTLEARVRGGNGTPYNARSAEGSAPAESRSEDEHTEPKPRGNAGDQSRAAAVADALTKRPPPAAG